MNQAKEVLKIEATTILSQIDALAVTLLSARNFTSENYALFHPGGALGRKLLLTGERLMYTGEKNPLVHQDRRFVMRFLP